MFAQTRFEGSSWRPDGGKKKWLLRMDFFLMYLFHLISILSQNELKFLNNQSLPPFFQTDWKPHICEFKHQFKKIFELSQKQLRVVQKLSFQTVPMAPPFFSKRRNSDMCLLWGRPRHPGGRWFRFQKIVTSLKLKSYTPGKVVYKYNCICLSLETCLSSGLGQEQQKKNLPTHRSEAPTYLSVAHMRQHDP